MRTAFVAALVGTGFIGSAFAGQPDTLGRWMGGGECPWGNKTASGSHPQDDIPDTGVTRYYDFTVARATLAPDGVSQAMIVVNGQYPAPLIEANWGDFIEVTVRNQIYGPGEPTSMHWHGLNQHGTPFSDGVVTVSQCPIVPGGSLTYRFRAGQYGTAWYHSHYSAQYVSGVVGPIVIHGPNDVGYDEELYPIIVSDHFHASYVDLVNLVMAPSKSGLPFQPLSDSNLVVGAAQYPCANVTNGAPCSVVPYKSFEFEAGKTYRLRFINTGATSFEHISIDGHTMTVIANDFVPIQPYQTEYVEIGVGQRVDVLVTANQAPRNYWLRAYNGFACGDELDPDGRAIIYYAGSDPSVEPTSTAAAPGPVNSVCANVPLTSAVPQYVIPAAEPDTTITINVTANFTEAGVFLWYMNGVSYKGDLANPILLQAAAGKTNFPAEYNIINTGAANTVRIIIINTTPAPHPMHLHGHDFQVLAEGFGTWNGTIANPANPQRRDTQMVWAGGSPEKPSYIVVQFTQDNPGVWPLHCHLPWHLTTGMNSMILEHPEKLATMEIPDSVTGTCPTYTTWLNANPGVAIDDSLRKRTLGKGMGRPGHVYEHVQVKRGIRGLRGFGRDSPIEEYPNVGKYTGNAAKST